MFLGYYMSAVKEFGGIPVTVRSDRGTENCLVGICQEILREEYGDSSRPAYMVGRSTANQRIESWWGILRKECSQFYMDIFEDLKDNGYFSGDALDKEILRFCFMNIIQVIMCAFHNDNSKK